MSLPPKIQTWLDHNCFPQRVLLSGGENTLDLAIQIAAQLQGDTIEKIRSGVHADTIVLKDEGKSLKIDYSDAARRDGQSENENIRGMIKWISQKSISPYRIIILENMERASREAPQALLKILEEPPEKGIFLFTTKNHHQILETIISRITVLNLPRTNNYQPKAENQAKDFLNAPSTIYRFRMIEDLDKEIKKEKNKQILHDFMTDIILVARANSKFYPYLELLLETQQSLTANANMRLTLERLALKLKN